MALVFVQRYAPATAGAATQYVTGTLDVSAGCIVEFDPTIFTVPGTYTIFSYGTLTGTVGNFSADAASLTECGFTSAVFAVDSVQKIVTVTLS